MNQNASIESSHWSVTYVVEGESASVEMADLASAKTVLRTVYPECLFTDGVTQPNGDVTVFAVVYSAEGRAKQVGIIAGRP